MGIHPWPISRYLVKIGVISVTKIMPDREHDIVLASENRTFYGREEIGRFITPEYIRGLFEGGTFSNDRRQNGARVPCVTLKMHFRDKALLEGIRDYFKLRNRVYEYTRRWKNNQSVLNKSGLAGSNRCQNG